MPLPGWAKDIEDGKDARHRKPKRHEEDTAKVLGGRRNRGSGASPNRKSDVDGISSGLSDFQTECKRTEGSGLRVEAAWLNKITTEAGVAKVPMLVIQFERTVLERMAESGQIVAEADWVAIPRSAFKRLLEEAKASE